MESERREHVEIDTGKKAKQSAVLGKVMLDLESQTKVSGWDPVGDGAPWRVWEQGRAGLRSILWKLSLQQCRQGGVAERAKRQAPERKLSPTVCR